MIFWYAAGSAVMFVTALCAAGLMIYRAGQRDGVTRYRQEQGERRALRRTEARQATLGRHRLAPWPGPDPAEQLATTDQLRKLAEEGDIGEIRRQNAAFGRVYAFKRWAGIA